MLRNITNTLLAASLIVAVAACDDDDPVAPPQNAQVRIVNASPGTASLDVLRGTTVIASNIAFRTGSAACIAVPVGAQTLTFRATGTTTTVATLNTNFTANQNITVALFGTTAGRTAVAFTDVVTAPATGNAAIRFINASATAGDVYVTTPSGMVGSTSLAQGNLGPNAATTAGFATFPTANSRIRLFNVGTTTTTRADINPISLPANRLTTVFFTDVGTPAGPTSFTVQPCSP